MSNVMSGSTRQAALAKVMKDLCETGRSTVTIPVDPAKVVLGDLCDNGRSPIRATYRVKAPCQPSAFVA